MNSLPQILQALGTFLIGCALTVGVIIGAGAIKDGGQARTLSVTGKATKSISPNQSVISGTWEETANNSNEARNKVREKAAQGLEAIKSKGIDEKKITTTQVSVYPNYDYTISTGKPKITGYRASSSLEVKLDDPKKADEIISTMTGAGASSTSGPSFGFTPETRDGIEQELKLIAVTNARSQAEALAKQSGARLGKVISVTGGELIEPNSPRPYAISESISDKAVTDAVDISVGEKELTATVSVIYRLR